ncbi:MAG: division/cell wall cluster transcriptional repressor MraZ [Planctomycetota bacterium]
MLFTGEFEHTIDAKQRLAIPSDIRAILDPEKAGATLYLAPGANGHLWLWPEATFHAMSQAMGASLLPGEEQSEFELLLYSQARRLELDGSGRVRLQGASLSRFGLSTAVTILGVKDHLELRDTATWSGERDQKLDKLAEIMLRARQARTAGDGASGGKQDGS